MAQHTSGAPTLNIVGGGNVAKTLGYLWVQNELVNVNAILNRSRKSAESTVSFIKSGTAVSTASKLSPADITLIGCSDSSIKDCAQHLKSEGILRRGDVVFHCSGLLSSEELSALKTEEASLASAHPLLSFANPNIAMNHVSGSFCGLEGDPAATSQLRELFENIGFSTFTIEQEHKALYHAAAVIACNYTVTLQDIALQCLHEAGIDNSLGKQLLWPLLNGTVNNLKDLQPAHALTGPIARGDVPTVETHLEALNKLSPQISDAYQKLGLLTLPLAEKQSNATPAQLEALATLLSQNLKK